MFTSYSSRIEAGKKLGKALASVHLPGEVLVLGLPRGGVPVAAEVASAVGAQLDIIVVRKIGAPNNPELACGAVASGDVVVWNRDLLRRFTLLETDFAEAVRLEKLEVKRREEKLRGPAAEPPHLQGKTIVLVDDGLATGASIRAAIQAVKVQHPLQLIVAVPVAPADTCEELEEQGVHIECLQKIPSGRFSSVGEWYEDFSQVTTAECRRILEAYVAKIKNESGRANDFGLGARV